MRSMTFLVNDRSTGGSIPAVAITITQNDDGSISFALSVIGSYTGDLRGFFFDLADESCVGTLSVTSSSAGLTEFREGNDSVTDLGNGANMLGLLGGDGGYDAGIEIGTAGIGGDDYQNFEFTLTSSAGPLTLEDFAEVDFGLRLTSVGYEDGERDASVKLLEHTSSAIDARDDVNAAAEDGAPNPVGGNVFGNDANLNLVHLVTAVQGSGDKVGEEVQGTYGVLHLDSDGTYTYTLDNTRAAVQALAQGQQVSETFSYTAKNFDELTSFSSDSAVLVITITGTNDAPVITPVVVAGSVAELADHASEESTAIHAASGSLNFVDVDLNDSHAISVVPAAAGYLGTFSTSLSNASTGDGAGQVSWSFEVLDAEIEHLGVGDTLTQTYTLSVDDGHGGTDTQDVTITITGANDAPEIVAGGTMGDVFEDGSRRASGQLTALDIDLSDSLTWSVAGSGPMTPGADYRFLLDNLNIVRNGATFFNDDFGNGVPPPAGTSFGYFTSGTFLESGGRVILDGGLGSPFTIPGAGTVIAQAMTLNTDIGPDVTQGLKREQDFKVEARFDLVMPAEGRVNNYLVRLSDGADDIVEVGVRRMEDGSVAVVLREVDLAGSVPVIADQIALEPAAGDNQIVLRLEHAANTNSVTASFDLLNGGVVTRTETFDVAADIFSNEGWTRAQIIGQSLATPQNGVYGTLSVEADGQWTYALNNRAANVQALGQDDHVTDTFTVRVIDEHGASDTQTVTVDVTGSNDAPIITGGTNNGFVVEDAVPTATGQLFAADPDHGALLRWSAGPASQLPVPGGILLQGYSSDHHFTLDQFTVTRNGAAIFDDTFSDGNAPPAAPNFANGTFASYLAGGGYTESGGRLHLDGALAGAQRGIANSDLTVGQLALLGTNTDPADLGRGLKSDDSFTVEARFDLAVPADGEAYGISLTDNTFGGIPPDQLGDDNVSLLVRRGLDGSLFVQLSDFNIVTDATGQAPEIMAFAPAAGENQIVLRLIHDVANPGVVRAEFDLLGGADGPRTLAFTQSRQIFGTGTPGYAGDDENWTRPQIIAFGPDTGGGTFRGTYGSLTVLQNGQWTYTLDNGSANVQGLGLSQPGQLLAQDVISVRVVDEHGLSSFRPVFINVAGSNDPVVVTGGVVSGAVQEDTILSASGTVTFTDIDLADGHTALFAPGGVYGTFSLGPVIEAPNAASGSVSWSYDLHNALVQSLAEGETRSETFLVTVQDNWGSSATQPVSVTIHGTNDRPDAIDDVFTGGASGAQSIAEVEGNNNLASAQQISQGQFGLSANPDVENATSVPWMSIAGRIGPDNGGANDVDMYRLDLSAGQTLTLDVDYGMPDLDSIVHIFDAAGNTVAIRDDFFPETVGAGGSSHSFDSYLAYTAPTSGTYYFSVSSYSNFAFSNASSFSNSGLYNGGDYVLNVSLTGVTPGSGGGSDGITEDQTALIDVLANDFDIDFADAISVSGFAASAYGAVLTLNADGSFLYDPRASAALQALNDGQSVTDTFTYTITDDHGATDTATASVTVRGVSDGNSPPVATDGSFATDEDVAVSGALTATDADGDTLSFSFTTAPQHGSVVLNSDGSFVYTPHEDYSGADSFQFRVEDGRGGEDIDTAEFDIVAVADEPTLTVPQSGAGGDSGQFEITHDTSGGEFEFAPRLTALNDGGFIATWYAHDFDAGGDSWDVFAQRVNAAGQGQGIFQVSADDAGDLQHDQQQAVALLENGNLVFVWRNLDGASSDQDIVGRVFDLNGTALTPEFIIDTVEAALPGSAQPVLPEVAKHGDGFVVTWARYEEPGTNSSSIFGRAFDSWGSATTGRFEVNPSSPSSSPFELHSPVVTLADDSYVVLFRQMLPEGHVISGQRYDAAHSPAGTSFVVASGGNVDWPDLAALPDGGFVASWTSFTPQDGNGLFVRRFAADGSSSGPTVVSNDPGSFQSAIAATADGGFAVAWRKLDAGSWDTVVQRFDPNGSPLGGVEKLNTSATSSQFVTFQQGPDIAALQGGDFAVAWHGDSLFQGQSQTNIFGHVPGSDAGGLVTNEDVAVGLQISAALNDTDGSETLAVTISGVPQGASLSAGFDNGGIWTLGADQLAGLMLTPAANSHEDITLAVTATATEGVNGDQASVTKSFTITVNSVNDAPEITGGTTSGSVQETDNPALAFGQVFATDPDGFSSLTWTVLGGNPGFNPGVYGNFLLHNNGAWVYELNANDPDLQQLDGGESAPDVFTVRVADEHGAFDDEVVTITVHGAGGGQNSAPTARPDNNDHDAVFEAGVDFSGLPSAGDPTARGNVILGTFGLGVDTDPDGDTLLVTAASVGGMAAQLGLPIVLTYGSLVINEDGSWTYTLDNADPDTNALRQTQAVFNEPAFEQVVTYTVSDGQGGTDSAELTIRVSGTNDAPIVATDTNSVTEHALDQPVSVMGNVLANDRDPEGSSLQVFGPPPGSPPINGRYGTLAINPDGSYTYTTDPARVNFLDAGEVAHDIFEGRYAVSEVFEPFGGQATVTATLLDIAITGTDEAPSFADGVVFEDGARGTTGQIDLSTASTWSITGAGSMTPWAEYRFRLDNLNIIKNNAFFFNDDFGNGAPPPNGPGFSYLTGGTFTETGGRANMDGSFSVMTAPGFAGHSAILNTDTTADLNSGLKRNHDFRVEARFDLVIPDQALQTYGIRLSDSGVPGGGDDVVEIAVRRMEDGSVSVILREGNVVGSVPVILAAIPLGNQAGDNRIVLRLEHTANTDEVRGSFDLIDGDVVRQSTSFGATVGHIFGNESWTRAQFVGFSPSQPQNGVYGTLSVQQDGQWTYSLNNGIANVQALAQGERVTDSFTVHVTDALGVSDTQTVSVDVIGSNDTPFGSAAFFSAPAPGTVGAYVIEDGAQQTASGTAFSSDIDHGHPVQWSVTANVLPGPVTAYSADYLFKVDELSITRDGAAFLLDTFNDGVPPPASAPTFNYIVNGGFSEPTGSGRAILDGHRGVAIGGAGTADVIVANVAVLDTNLGDASPGRGLKSHHDFMIEARFDLDPQFLPTLGQAFALSLSDRSLGETPPDQLGDDIVGLLVTRDADGHLVVQFEERDGVADSVNILHSELLVTPLSASQIVLRLEHDKDDGNFGLISASFEVISAGTVRQDWSSSADPLRADRIFGAETPDDPYDDEVWTRAQIWAFGPDTLGGSAAQGTYGSFSFAPDGDWTYTLNNGAANVQALGQGQIAVDSFNVRTTDAYGASTSRQFNVNVIGTGDDHAGGLQVNGGAAADTLIGSPFDDLITGGGGSDLLIGLAGRDTFKFNAITEGMDTISDFTPGVGGDVLDIRDVLQGYTPVPGIIPFSFVQLQTFPDTSGVLNTTVAVNADGVGFDYVPLVTLQGVGGLLLHEMMNNGNLVLA